MLVIRSKTHFPVEIRIKDIPKNKNLYILFRRFFFFYFSSFKAYSFLAKSNPNVEPPKTKIETYSNEYSTKLDVPQWSFSHPITFRSSDSQQTVLPLARLSLQDQESEVISDIVRSLFYYLFI